MRLQTVVKEIYTLDAAIQCRIVAISDRIKAIMGGAI